MFHGLIKWNHLLKNDYRKARLSRVAYEWQPATLLKKEADRVLARDRLLFTLICNNTELCNTPSDSCWPGFLGSSELPKALARKLVFMGNSKFGF
jgi:hypothetical protein